MRKLITIITIALCTCVANAQFKIDANSHAALKTTTDTNYVFRINASSGSIGGLQVNRYTNNYTQNGTPISSAVYGHTNHQSIAFSQGIRGYATNTSPINIGRTFGVFGVASGATDGYNYGVFGVLAGTSKGAGVYGTNSDSDYGQALDSRYAGYFNGPVKVQGNLTVTGNISGVLLCTPPPSSPSAQRTDATTISQLNSLNAYAYYHESSDVRQSRHVTDTAETVFPLTHMEQQVLSKQHFGLDVEQLEEVFPDLVYEDENGSKSINYVEMVPILVHAINELSVKFEALEGNNGTIKKSQQKATGINDAEERVTLLSLGQNKPNPFGTTTTIEVSVPESVQKAFIYVYDLQGKKVEQVDITARGKQNIQLSSANLTDGMYLYSLIADGKVVVTRRMIVEK